jgi:hypothetical protein
MKCLLVCSFLLATTTSAFSQMIVRWGFEGVTTTNTGTDAIVSVGSAVADSGAQTAGSFFSAHHASASTVWSNPVGNGTAKSVSANNWAVGDYFQFQFNTVGFSNLFVAWDQTGSNTGPRDFKVQYSTDGVNYTDATGTNSTYSLVVSNWSNTIPRPEHTRILDLSGVTSLNNNPSVYIRLVANSTTSINGGTVGTTGTGRVDFFIVYSGAPLPVQLASFTGTSTSVGCVGLNWTTISEINNYGFSVQRSRDRIAIIDVPNSFVPGNGTTNERHEYAFRECGVSSGTWYYRLRQIDLDGSEHFSEWIHLEVLGVTSVGENLPKHFELKQNFPNPFNPETIIHFSVEREGRATLRVFNIIGQPVAVLYDDVAQPSTLYSVKFDGKQLTSGIYFYKLESGNQSAMKKLMLLK